MIATDFTRTDCQLGTKRVTFAALQREYRCNECEGRVVVKATDGGYCPECGICGGQDFVHEYEIERQRHEALEVLEGLPPELAAAIGHERQTGEPQLRPLGGRPADI
jgi:hypothetical protein